MRLGRIGTVLAATGLAVVVSAGPALAHECFNTQKAAGSGGTVGTYYFATDTFVPSGQPGQPTFVEVVFPDGHSVFLFLHSGGEDGVVNGAKDCDGKGLDNFKVCIGAA